MESGTDESLWAAGLRGDDAAFAVLFDRHHARVHRHALRLLPVAADADAVTVLAFLELWRRRRDVRIVGGSLLPWLLVTATNLTRNNRRSARRYEELLRRLPRERPVPDVADVGQDGVVTDDGLREALRSLRPIDLHLLTLVALEGYSVVESSALVGVSTGAAKVRLHRTRTRLRTVLTEHPAARLTAPEGQPS